MSPTHANKAGVRYRYYTSQALLQGRKAEAGSVGRVSAVDIEKLIADALHHSGRRSAAADDRQRLDALDRATIYQDRIEIVLRENAEDVELTPPTINIPFAPTSLPVKGVARAPSAPQPMDDKTRTALLTAIVRSKAWIDAIIADPAMDFATIARNEKLAERHVRFLAPLAYISPRIIEAIADGRAPWGSDANRVSAIFEPVSTCARRKFRRLENRLCRPGAEI